MRHLARRSLLGIAAVLGVAACSPGKTPQDSPTSIPSTLSLNLDEGVTLDFVLIPAGEFVMGSALDPEQSPPHTVTLAKPFYMSATEITNAHLRVFRPEFDANDRRGGANLDYQVYIRSLNPEFNGNDQPAVYVPWSEAEAFTQLVSYHTGRICRLPSEAEWEYACRAGSGARYAWGDDPRLAARYANTNDPVTASQFRLKDPFPRDDGHRATAPVASYAPNAFGLYDMHGNVAEWTADHWHDHYHGAPSDGSAWIDSLDTGKRVTRGGSFECSPQGAHFFSCAASGRSWNYLGNGNFGTGFRVVVEVGSGKQ